MEGKNFNPIYSSSLEINYPSEEVTVVTDRTGIHFIYVDKTGTTVLQTLPAYLFNVKR